jgi:hypothetical protein
MSEKELKKIEEIINQQIDPINEKIDMLLQLLLSDEPEEEEAEDNDLSFDDLL